MTADLLKALREANDAAVSFEAKKTELDEESVILDGKLQVLYAELQKSDKQEPA